ncbi:MULTISPECIES: MBL fold metallo-hydrolase RNA specificity domain-containing protein [Olleya]|uniref:Metallo-beta-lactamase family protein n=1 Tax=Olleya namhaensis TaxID=1144750 RepID=A0A1I3MMY2_9FLAO|nr:MULTISPECIES: MBL fold metallo-hydrolase [Olleya]PKG52675.1 MBL fold metallo-hydrolase [Olleya sp. 1-3]SFI98388.1 metallo-beta-lactamase family protein [Olleya namhaensis]
MKTKVKITFLGGAKTVTGSKYLIEAFNTSILIDCGLFQGLKDLRQLNWNPLPIAVSKIETILLTHGHLDHVGYLPRLIKQGFNGKIIGTAPTLAIAEIILKDSAKIQEEEAKKANKEKYTKHQPALPFYTAKEVDQTVSKFEVQVEDKWIAINNHISYRFKYNGHIIGSTFIELDIEGKRFVFSGDIGRVNDYLLNDPKRPDQADYLFLESTYGNKLHPIEDIENKLTQIIKETINTRGNLIIPSFAVERLQMLMFILFKLYQKNKIPNIPIFVDSPMGNNVLEIFKRFPKWHKLSETDYNAMCKHINIIKSYADTWKTIDDPRSKIIIAGSGMVTGGRVLTYLQQLIDDASTTILLVGYQAEGTRGRLLKEGAHEIKFYGKYYPVKAAVLTIDSLSAHADQNGLLHWLSAIKNTPKTVYLIHGEPTAQNALRVKIKDTFNWYTCIPNLFETIEIEL